MTHPHNFLRLSLAAFLTCLSIQITHAATTTTPPAPPKTASPNQVQQLQAIITGVRGLVQVRRAEDQPWIKAETGMALSQGAEFRTGPRSTVQFKIPPDQTVTLDRLGTIKLLTAIRQAGKFKTDLGMKYGRTRYDIRKAGFEHESTIRSPSATLSVRGTRVGIQDGAFGYFAWSTQSRARLMDRSHHRHLTFGDHAQVTDQSRNAADYANRFTTVDPGDDRSRQGDEIRLINLRPGGDANPGFDNDGFNPTFDRHEPPSFDLPSEGFAPGSLRFELTWQSSDVTDLDLYVQPPSYTGDNIITPFPTADLPGSALSSPSGGHVDSDLGDDINGSSPTTGPNAFGREAIEWEGQFPVGLYQVGVVPFSLPSSSKPPSQGTSDSVPSQAYQIQVQVKPPNAQNFTTLHTIQGTVPENLINIHDVGVSSTNATDQKLTQKTNNLGEMPRTPAF